MGRCPGLPAGRANWVHPAVHVDANPASAHSCPQVQLDIQPGRFDPYSGLRGASPMVVEVQQAEKRSTRRFALRLPVSVNYQGNTGPAMSAQTRDVSARGICFYLESPLGTCWQIEFTLTLPAEITLTESVRGRFKGKVVHVDSNLTDAKVPVAAVIDEYEFLSEA